MWWRDMSKFESTVIILQLLLRALSANIKYRWAMGVFTRNQPFKQHVFRTHHFLPSLTLEWILKE